MSDIALLLDLSLSKAEEDNLDTTLPWWRDFFHCLVLIYWSFAGNDSLLCVISNGVHDLWRWFCQPNNSLAGELKRLHWIRQGNATLTSLFMGKGGGGSSLTLQVPRARNEVVRYLSSSQTFCNVWVLFCL